MKNIDTFRSLWPVFWIAAAYLSGSILYGQLILKKFCQKDIRAVSADGNPGTYNVFIYGGTFWGVLTLVLDLAKGFVPIWLYRRHINAEDLWLMLVIIAPAAGHAFPVWQGFSGGKAIAVSFGCLLGLLPDYGPVLILAAFYLLGCAMKISPHEKRTIAAFLCSAATIWFCINSLAIRLACIGISAIVIYRNWQGLPQK